METGHIIVILVGCGVIGLLSILGFIAKSVQRKLAAHIQGRFAEDEIIGVSTKANFLGLQSRGGKQFRGNAALVLTPQNLFSIRAIPFQEIAIPIRAITKISLPTSFNGKSIFRKLLCVHYFIDGREDEMAWAVRNPEHWKKSIEAIIEKSVNP